MQKKKEEVISAFISPLTHGHAIEVVEAHKPYHHIMTRPTFQNIGNIIYIFLI